LHMAFNKLLFMKLPNPNFGQHVSHYNEVSELFNL
jgi:hypothetical protein